jgi:biotin carboxyl carrier protein
MNLPIKIKNLFFKDIKLLRTLFLFAGVLGLLELTIPFAVQAIINRIYKTYLFEPVVLILGLVLFFLIIQSVYMYLRFSLVESFQRRIFSRVSHSLTEHLFKSKKHQSFNYEIRFFEVITLTKSMSKFLSGGLGLILSLVFGFSILLFYHAFFAILILIIVISYTSFLFLFHRKATLTSRKESKAKYAIASEIHKISEEKCTLADVSDKIEDFLECRERHFSHLQKQYISVLLIYILSHILLLGIGGTLVLSGELSIGQLVASELIFSVILSVFAKSIQYIETYYDCVASFEKLEFIDEFNDHKSKLLNVNQFDKVYSYTKRALIISPLFLFILPWVQTSEGLGQLTTLDPSERTQEISSFVGGRIKKWYVVEGEEVKKDQPLVEIIDVDPQYIDRLQNDRDASFKKYQAIRLAAETAKIDFKRQKSLFKEGLTSRVKYEKAQIYYQKLIAKEAEAASSLAKSETSFARQQKQIVTAPSDGFIHQLFSGNTSSIVKKGTMLAVFVPRSTSSVVEVYVDGNDIPLIYTGRTARVEFEGFPALMFSGWPELGFGTFKGVVKAVDSIPSKGGKFRVMIGPADGAIWPNDKILRRGSKSMAWIQMNTVSLIFEIWRQFNGFPAAPDQVALDKGKNEKSK